MCAGTDGFIQSFPEQGKIGIYKLVGDIYVLTSPCHHCL
jgi:hypothetical protein